MNRNNGPIKNINRKNSTSNDTDERNTPTWNIKNDNNSSRKYSTPQIKQTGQTMRQEDAIQMIIENSQNSRHK